MLRALFLLIVCTFLSGCFTALMWSHSSVDEYTYRNVEIDGFFVNDVRSKLIVTSYDNAYSFSISESFADTLMLSREIQFTPEFANFIINEENEIKGSITLTYKFAHNDDRSPEQTKALRAQLASLGFKASRDKMTYTRDTSLHGRKHLLPEGIQLQRLDKKLTIRVRQPASIPMEVIGDVTEKVLLTPVTLLIDSIVTPVLFMQDLTRH
ncbi:hypothetical protein [Ostreibacterium oceani]|uniref:Lipoprotein n=1 Tax=Ostreibacterium oceani TaxID=2654998 RepID=A0A6N7EW22_9GAMM|nr:hypothetical protein [Ostreibacterium oceani]MPV86751.1 hypothetical protein [Ostreibacterium oceani]